MRASVIAMVLGQMQMDIDKVISKAKDDLVKPYDPDRSSFDNEEISDLIELHSKMVDYLIVSALNSVYTKKNDEVKKALDEACRKCGFDPDGEAGITKIIKDNGELIFSKRQNKDSEACTIQDLCVQLQLLNVDKKTIDKAIEKATKPKKGNTYYIVQGSES